MSEPLLTQDEALERAKWLIEAFDREPDTLSPDEQALVIALKYWISQRFNFITP